MIWVFAIITLAYLFLLLFLLFGFGKVPEQRAATERASVGFSVIVPFRNEAANLPALLSSFQELIYPKDLFQIILVNDNSEDNSVEICMDFIAANPQLKLKLAHSVNKTGSPKKNALETGIREAEFPYILTTDADCTVPEKWLAAFNSIIKKTAADMVSGPVILKSGNSFLTRFQEIDFFSLQASTIGGYGVNKAFMCNGANLCYRKNNFIQAKGFRGNENIASGDDIFLLQKFRNAGFKTVFLKNKDAIVVTNPQPDLKTLLMQRIRWAAKSSAYKDLFPKAIGLTVFLMNFFIVAGVILWALGFKIEQYFLLAFLIKFNLDFILIYRGAHFFGRERSMKNYFWASVLYPFFCCSVVIFSGLTGYNWKGRKFRK